MTQTRWDRIRQRRARGAQDSSLSFQEKLTYYCARVFSTPDGQALLGLLADRYVFVETLEAESESALREFLGSRNLVLLLERCTSEGTHAGPREPESSAQPGSEPGTSA